MAKSKYNPEIQEIIASAIATEGGDESGWIAGGISKATFYDWLSRYSDFSDAIARAREEFRKNCPPALKRSCLNRLRDIIENGYIVTRTRTLKPGSVRRYKGKPGDDNLWWTEVTEPTTETREENRGIPQWAIDRILPKPPPDIESAIALLERYGFAVVVKDQDKLNELITEIVRGSPEDSVGTGGLTNEQANEIRRRILGIPEDSAYLN